MARADAVSSRPAARVEDGAPRDGCLHGSLSYATSPYATMLSALGGLGNSRVFARVFKYAWRARRAFSAKMGSLAPFLSKAGDLGDFPDRYNLLNFIEKNFRAALRVEYSKWGRMGNPGRKFAQSP
jgi:hypothetical protein